MVTDRNRAHCPTRGRGLRLTGGSSPAGSGKRCTGRPRDAGEAPGLPLVPEDRLCFRVETRVHDDLDLASVAHSFRATFTSAWRRIPLADRKKMLHFWRCDGDSLATLAGTPTSRPAPFIEIVSRPDLTGVEVASFGRTITVPATLVVGQVEQLPWEIARSLAQVYLLVTREHWALIVKLLNEPLTAWEAGQGGRASFERRERKLDTLERTFLARHDARMAAILASWGCEAPGTPPDVSESKLANRPA